MIWECVDAAYCGKVTMRDVTHAGIRGRRCAEVIVSGAQDAVESWLAAEPSWRDEADRLDGVRAAMARGLRVESREIKAIHVPAVNVTVETREFTAHLHGADVTWYEADYPEYLYRPDPYRYEETCRRICRWAAKVGVERIEAMTFAEFSSAVADVAGRTPVCVRQYTPSAECDGDIDFIEAYFPTGGTDLDPVPF